MTVSRRVVLKAHPRGRVREQDFAIEQAALPDPGEGEFLVRNRWLSVDPMLRIFVDAHPLGGRMPPLPVGSVIPGAAVGEVIASRHPDFPAGAIVEGRLGWQDHALSDGARVERFDPAFGPPETALGLLGLPGFSAYVGLHVAGPLEPGRTLLVSGAAGAVGTAVGLLARERGVGRLVGIASGREKADYLLRDIGYDAVADRTAPDFQRRLADATGGKVDVYFDNVGYPLMLDMLPHLAQGARVMICGLMGQYDDFEGGEGPDNLPRMLGTIMAKGLTVRAFSNTAWPQLRADFLREMGDIVRGRPEIARPHCLVGLESTPAAFVQLFDRGVTGKLLVKLP